MYIACKNKNAESVRRSRQKLYQNNDWHISGITRFFVGWKVQKSKYVLDVCVTEQNANIVYQDAKDTLDWKLGLHSYVDTYETDALTPVKLETWL